MLALAVGQENLECLLIAFGHGRGRGEPTPEGDVEERVVPQELQFRVRCQRHAFGVLEGSGLGLPPAGFLNLPVDVRRRLGGTCEKSVPIDQINGHGATSAQAAVVQPRSVFDPFLRIGIVEIGGFLHPHGDGNRGDATELRTGEAQPGVPRRVPTVAGRAKVQAKLLHRTPGGRCRESVPDIARAGRRSQCQTGLEVVRASAATAAFGHEHEAIGRNHADIAAWLAASECGRASSVQIEKAKGSRAEEQEILATDGGTTTVGLDETPGALLAGQGVRLRAPLPCAQIVRIGRNDETVPMDGAQLVDAAAALPELFPALGIIGGDAIAYHHAVRNL